MNASERRFLVVDDYPHLRVAVCRVLSRLGYPDAGEAGDGAEALEKLFAVRYDFVISDISMPNMDGFELLRRMKASPALRHIPVILVTAHSQAQYRITALALGAAGFLLKPFDSETLEATIAEVLAGS